MLGHLVSDHPAGWGPALGRGLWPVCGWCPRDRRGAGGPLEDREGQRPDQLEVAVGTLMRHLHCYIMGLAAERVSRDTDIWLEPPTLANLFDAEREVRGQRRAAEGP